MMQAMLVSVFLAILVYSSGRSYSEEPDNASGVTSLKCKIQASADMLEEEMAGVVNWELEPGEASRTFFLRDLNLTMALVREDGRSAETPYRVSRSRTAIDLYAKLSLSVSINYEIRLSDLSVVYTEIIHDPFQDGSSTFFVAKGKCHDTFSEADDIHLPTGVRKRLSDPKDDERNTFD